MTTTVRPYKAEPEALVRYIQGLIRTGRKHEAARLLRIGFDVEPLTIYHIVNHQAAIKFQSGLLHVLDEGARTHERSV